jgi:hypothetical protein
MWRRKRGRDLVRDYERLVPDAVQRHLGPEAAALFGRQIESVVNAVRLYGDTGLNLYPTAAKYRCAAAWQPRRSGEPAMSPAASGSRTLEPVTEEDS